TQRTVGACLNLNRIIALALRQHLLGSEPKIRFDPLICRCSHRVGLEEPPSPATKREREATRHPLLRQYKVAWLPEWSSHARDKHGKTSDRPYNVQWCYRWHRRMLYHGLWRHVGNRQCRVSREASKVREVLKLHRQCIFSA